MGYQTFGRRRVLQDAFSIDLPKRQSQRGREFIPTIERDDDLERVAHDGDNLQGAQRTAPERQRQAGARVFPAPGELLLQWQSQASGALAK